MDGENMNLVPKSIKIGTADLKYGLFLAPMAGVSDAIFRKICRSFGAEYAVSEMISAKALCYEQLSKKAASPERVKTAALAKVKQDDMPLAIQLFGNDPEYMAETAEMIEKLNYRGCLSDCAPVAIDINMGCPVAKVVGNGEGSALMKSPELCGRIVRAIADRTDLPVTVKIRTGWDEASKNAAEVAKICEANGATAVCVHGRTRADMYTPGVDRKTIAKVKSAVKIPVIANGDIFTVGDAISMYEDTGCDGIMIARGALGNPWIFSQLTDHFNGNEVRYPTPREKIELAIHHAQLMIEENDRTGFIEARKHIAWYIKGLQGSASVRNSIMTLNSFEEVKKILWSLVERH